MSERRILFVVEGSRGEPRFLRKMYQVLFGDNIENIVWYGTAIHDLLERMFPEGAEDPELDLISVLRETVKDQSQRDMLEKEYSDVYLVFDMDPHHQKYDRALLDKAMDFFDDPTQEGKLYLNYPMLESFKHLKEHRDPEYIERTVSVDSLSGYKSQVESECHPDFKDVGKYSEETFKEVIEMNLMKANAILEHAVTIPDVRVFRSWSGSDFLREQNRLMESERRLYVLNTSAFIAVDHWPSMFLSGTTNAVRA